MSMLRVTLSLEKTTSIRTYAGRKRALIYDTFISNMRAIVLNNYITAFLYHGVELYISKTPNSVKFCVKKYNVSLSYPVRI